MIRADYYTEKQDEVSLRLIFDNQRATMALAEKYIHVAIPELYLQYIADHYAEVFELTLAEIQKILLVSPIAKAKIIESKGPDASSQFEFLEAMSIYYLGAPLPSGNLGAHWRHNLNAARRAAGVIP